MINTASNNIKDCELNIRNDPAITKAVLQREKEIYFLHILPPGKKKKAMLHLCDYARI